MTRVIFQEVVLQYKQVKTFKQLILFGLALAAVLDFSSAVYADNTMTRFQPLSGYLVQVDSNGIVIDCGQQKGVASGDLFTVLDPGKPLIHPITGQSLGSRETVVAVLKVIRVTADHAICRPLKRYLKVSIKPGSSIKRFSTMAALFIDLNGNGIELFSHLREALPELNWADYKTGLKLQQTLRQPGGPGSLGYDLYAVNKGPDLTLYNSDNELVKAMNAGRFSNQLSTANYNDKNITNKKNKGRYFLTTTDSGGSYINGISPNCKTKHSRQRNGDRRP